MLLKIILEIVKTGLPMTLKILYFWNLFYVTLYHSILLHSSIAFSPCKKMQELIQFKW